MASIARLSIADGIPPTSTETPTMPIATPESFRQVIFCRSQKAATNTVNIGVVAFRIDAVDELRPTIAVATSVRGPATLRAASSRNAGNR